MKRIIIIIVLVIIAFGAWYGWKEYHRKNADLEEAKATVSVDAASLISAFEKDSATANKKYIDQVIAVKGKIKSINADGNPVVLALGEDGQMSSVQCSMDSTHASDYKSVQVGAMATLKGICTGALTQELFGTDVQLNRCVIQKQ